MPKAKKKSQKKKKPVAVKPGLNPKHELFCQFYVKNSELFGNATLSYAEAYAYSLDELSRAKPMDAEGKPTDDSEYQKQYNVCSVEGHRLLRSPKIQDRLTKLLNEMLKDDVVDRELVKVILQDHKPEAKVAAIREYNKLKARITEKVEHSGNISISNVLDQLEHGPAPKGQAVAPQPSVHDKK